MEHYEISKLLNDSIVSKFVTTKMDGIQWFFEWTISCQQKHKI